MVESGGIRKVVNSSPKVLSLRLPSLSSPSKYLVYVQGECDHIGFWLVGRHWGTVAFQGRALILQEGQASNIFTQQQKHEIYACYWIQLHLVIQVRSNIFQHDPTYNSQKHISHHHRCNTRLLSSPHSKCASWIHCFHWRCHSRATKWVRNSPKLPSASLMRSQSKPGSEVEDPQPGW